ncbi:hypothetical protein XMG48_002381 [Marinobacterium sp. xm-g-48]|uniref:hypothetical protein n=1 Tax=Marinobacterium sp. xm-g-48 TaxID=2497738 RepID=UPI001567D7AC|nr:hypothetical protein [Marinobacterium sp. xm-g-48]NRP11252.1 hypothetical protein [Marinobacterium sp. xm-g-48]
MTKQIFDLTKQSGERTLRANNFYNKTSSKKLCVKQNPTHGTAIHYSQKLNDIHELKPHERDYAVILDWSDDVVSYTSNIQLSASINKVTKTQKFSFLVHYKDKQVLVDIGSSQSPRHSNPRFSNRRLPLKVHKSKLEISDIISRWRRSNEKVKIQREQNRHSA